MKAVENGIYVGDNKIKFLAGETPDNFVVHTVADYNAIKGKIIDGSYLGGEVPITGRILYMLTEKGFCIGLNSGEFFNLTKDKYTDIDATGGSAVHRIINGTSQFLAITEN